MRYSFNDEVEEYKRTNPQLNQTDYFKFQEGLNKIRVLSKGEVLAEHFKLGICFGMEKGCPFHTEEYKLTPARIKWLMWIIDRSDNKIKLAKMPYGVIKVIGDLQKNEDFAFDEVPMPYDITISATNAGTKEVKYSVMPSIKRTEITEEETLKYDEQTPVEEIVQKMKDKQREKVSQDPLFQRRQEELRQELESSTGEVDSIYPEEEINPNEIPF